MQGGCGEERVWLGLLSGDLEARVAVGAVRVLPRDGNLSALAELHGANSVVPALDNAADTALVGERLWGRVGREEEAGLLVRGPEKSPGGSASCGRQRSGEGPAARHGEPFFFVSRDFQALRVGAHQIAVMSAAR